MTKLGRQQNYLGAKTHLNVMTGQLGQVLLALDTGPDDNTSKNESLKNDDDTYDRYYNREESVASVLPNNPISYENSAMVLGRGETCLWKSKSGLLFHVTVISTTFYQA